MSLSCLFFCENDIGRRVQVRKTLEKLNRIVFSCSHLQASLITIPRRNSIDKERVLLLDFDSCTVAHRFLSTPSNYHISATFTAAKMPTISVEIMVSTKITRIMELEISSPDMRSTEVPEHIQKYLLRDDEVLERTRIISTDPRLPNINLGDPKLEKIISERKPASHNLVFDQPLPNPVKTNLETSLSSKQISFTPSPYNAAKKGPEWLPRAQEEQYRRLPMSDHTGSSANSDAPPSSSVDEELLPSPVKFKSAHKRRSASDGDVLRSVNVRDFAFDRNAGQKDPLKTPSKTRTVHAKIMKSRSPTKEERFRGQVKRKCPDKIPIQIPVLPYRDLVC